MNDRAITWAGAQDRDRTIASLPEIMIRTVSGYHRMIQFGSFCMLNFHAEVAVVVFVHCVFLFIFAFNFTCRWYCCFDRFRLDLESQWIREKLSAKFGHRLFEVPGLVLLLINDDAPRSYTCNIHPSFVWKGARVRAQTPRYHHRQPIYVILFHAFVFLNRKWCFNNGK